MLTATRREQNHHCADTPANPAIQSFHALAVAQVTGVAARTGVFSQLADHPTGVAELAARLALEPEPLHLMLDILVAQGLVEYLAPNYVLSTRARRWLDPDSPTSVTTYLSSTLDFWAYWANLEKIVTGQSVAVASPLATDENGWLRHTRGDYEVARLVADEVAAEIALPEWARSVLDLGGGHGWFGAALCRRNPLLRATVIDHAETAEIGREIMWEAGLDQVVTHEVGDPAVAYLGRSHDAVLCLAMMSDLSSRMSLPLLHRVRQAMRPGALFAFIRPRHGARATAKPQPGSAAEIELFGCVRFGTGRPTLTELEAQLAAAGFDPPEARRLSAAPGLDLYISRAV